MVDPPSWQCEDVHEPVRTSRHSTYLAGERQLGAVHEAIGVESPGELLEPVLAGEADGAVRLVRGPGSYGGVLADDQLRGHDRQLGRSGPERAGSALRRVH